MEKLKTSLNSSELLEKDNQALDTKAWLELMKALQVGSQPWPTATALLTAFHNIVTDTIREKWIPAPRRHYYCPSDIVDQLKAGVFSTDVEVLSKDSNNLSFVPPLVQDCFRIPGLAPSHRLVNCTSVLA